MLNQTAIKTKEVKTMITGYYHKNKMTAKQKAAEFVYDAMDKMIDFMSPDMCEGMTEKEKEEVFKHMIKYANRIMKLTGKNIKF